jgi:hypothetical protein
MWISSHVVDSVQYLQEENQLNLLEWIFLYENWNHNKDESSNHVQELEELEDQVNQRKVGQPLSRRRSL